MDPFQPMGHIAEVGLASTVERRLYIPRATIDYDEWQRADLT